MVKQHLLEKELKLYKKNKHVELKSVPFSKRLIDSLFEKFDYYEMTEISYCCCGEEVACWYELVEEGNWDLSLEDVKNTIESDIKYIKKYLYNQAKYGKRFYMYEDEKHCYIYIYTRDVVYTDYAIWFDMND